MRRGLALLLALSAWLECGWAGSGTPKQVQLRWEELESRILKRKVAMTLPDGTRVEGKAIRVEPDGLRCDISKTSNRDLQPKGEHLIPRQSISVLRVTQYRKLGRLLGALGGAALAGGIAAASYPDLYEGTVIVVVPVMVALGVIGAAIGGYYIGRAFDKQVVEIRVVTGPAR